MLDRAALERGEGALRRQLRRLPHEGRRRHRARLSAARWAARRSRHASRRPWCASSSRAPASPAAPGQRSYLAMPAFGRKLDDQEVADVVTYIRNAWGNRASVVDAASVAKSRKALAAATASR